MLGSYLARIGNCMGCHTAKGGQPFAGGRRLATSFGIFVTSNITPDKETGIGTMTKEVFISKFRLCLNDNFLDPKARGYNTPMAWNFIAKTATEDDLSAIYDYLMAQKPVNNKVEKITLQGLK